MAKTLHVIRPRNCSVAAIEVALKTIQEEKGDVVSIFTHSSEAGGMAGVTHDNRWCVVDIVYSKGK